MRRLQRTLAVLALGVLLVLPACTRESDENTNEGVDASGATVAIEVQLTDDAIEMPDEIPAGAAVFEVTNSGTTSHGFAIEDVDDGLEELTVDELDVLRLDLEPGTYVVYSPVDGDREAGLERELTVTEADASGNEDPADDGVGPSEEQDEIDDEGN